jgi:hypothetical protein
VLIPAAPPALRADGDVGGDALKNAEVPLAQLRQPLHILVLALRQRLSRLQRPRQIAAVDRGKRLVRRIEGHRQRLRPTHRVERDIGVALDALLHVPVGFAVADNADAGTDRSGNAGHDKCAKTRLYRS